MFNKHIKKIIAAIVSVVIIIASYIVPVFADGVDFTYNGTSASYSGTATGKGSGFAIDTGTTTESLFGYRFSIVDKNGNEKDGSHTIDIYFADKFASKNVDSRYFLGINGKVQRNKKEIKDIVDSGESYSVATVKTPINDSAFYTAPITKNGNTFYYDFSKSVYTDIIFSDGLPIDPAEMFLYDEETKEGWLTDENIDTICRYGGLSNGLSFLTSGDIILVEPVFYLKMANLRHVATIAEFALYGASGYGMNSIGQNSDGSISSGTIGYLYRHVTGYLPRLLMSPDTNDALWLGTDIIESNASSMLSTAKSKNRKTCRLDENDSSSVIGKYTGDDSNTIFLYYGTLINYGYGVSTITAAITKKELTVSYNANGGNINNNSSYSLETDSGMIQKDGSVYKETWVYNDPVPGGLANADEFGLSYPDYVFLGWGTSPNAETYFDQDDETIVPSDIYPEISNGSAEITLYAIWVPAYTVTFKFNGGTYNNKDSLYNDTYKLTNIPDGTSISLITAEKEGYILSYWERTVPKSTEKYGAESLYEVTCDTVFVAHWAVKSPNENTQNIIFDLNYDDAPKNLFITKTLNTQNGITATLNTSSNLIKLDGASSELSETQYYFNPVLNAGEYLSGATNLRVIVTHNSGGYFGSDLYFRIQANSETESFKKHNLLLPTEGVSTLDIPLSDDGIVNPKEISSLSYSIVSDDEVAVVLNNYDISIKILAVPKEENKYDNMTLPLGQMVIKNTVWSGNASIPQRPGYNFVGWSTDKSEYKAFNTSSLISDDVILYAIWVKNSANVVNVRFDENYKEVTPNLYTVDTYNGQPWTEEYETLYENGFPQNVKTQYTTYVQSDSYGVRVDLYPNKNRIRLSGTLKEGTFTVPLSSLNLILNKSDYFHLLIQKYGSYSLDMNFKNALFCVDVYDELGNELSGLCARINLIDIKQGMPAAYSISSEQIKELIGEKEFVNLRFDTYIGFNVKEGTTASLSSPFNNSKFDIAVTAKINESETLTEDDAECNAYSKNVPVNNVVGNLQYPIRNGYKFCGWYTDEALTENFVEDCVITSNPSGYITVYAKWAKLTSSDSRKVRFISSKYYELYYLDNENLPDNKALDYDEASGCYKALKQDGVLYYALKNGEPSSYVVDSCLSSYTHINKDGTYAVKVVSKWVNNDDYKAVLEESLRIAKGENPSNKKTYTITSEQRKEIKERANEHFENIKNGVSENSIFVNGNIDIDLTAYLKEE